MKNVLVRFLRSATLGIWLGGIVMAFITAGIVFEYLEPDRRKAGEIVGAILNSAGRVKLGLAIVALAAEAYLFATLKTSGWRKFTPGTFLMAAIICHLLTVFWLQPAILELRDKIGSFAEATANTPERIQFRKLHGLSMGLLTLEGIFVLFALFFGFLTPADDNRTA